MRLRCTLSLFLSVLIPAVALHAATGTKQRGYPNNFASVWAATIGALQGRGYPILLSDKTAGVITTDYKIEKDEEWRHKLSILLVNGGEETSVSVTSAVQNRRSSKAIAALSFGVVHTRQWEEEESDGTREAELLQAISKRLQPGGTAVDTAESNCRANFTSHGAVIRGTTYDTFEEFPRLRQEAAIAVINTSIASQALTPVTTDKGTGVITAQGRSPNGKPYTRDFVVTPTDDGVRVKIVQKLPAGSRGDDDAVRNDLCQIISALSVAIPRSAAPPSVSSAPADTPASAPSIEERLRKLDDIYKKHLITEEEYKKKRAELLSQM